MPRIDRYTEKVYLWGEPRPKPAPGEMQLIVDGYPPAAAGQVQAVDFLCPCGCGRNAFTPVVSARYAKSPGVWFYRRNGHWIDPSVRYLSGCKSHFYIRADGTVEWCP